MAQGDATTAAAAVADFNLFTQAAGCLPNAVVAAAAGESFCMRTVPASGRAGSIMVDISSCATDAMNVAEPQPHLKKSPLASSP